MFDLGLVFHDREFMKNFLTILTYPKQSITNYPYNLRVFDNISPDRVDKGDFKHEISLLLKNNSGNSRYEMNIAGMIKDEFDGSYAEQIIKDIYDSVVKSPLFNFNIYIINLQKNTIIFDKTRKG